MTNKHHCNGGWWATICGFNNVRSAHVNERSKTKMYPCADQPAATVFSFILSSAHIRHPSPPHYFFPKEPAQHDRTGGEPPSSPRAKQSSTNQNFTSGLRMQLSRFGVTQAFVHGRLNAVVL